MKSSVLQKKCFLLACIFFFLTSISVYSQKSWSVKLDYSKAFIENKGQFTVLTNNKIDKPVVLFAIDNGPVKIYFTKKGVIYNFIKAINKGKKEFEKENTTVNEWKEKEEKERRKRFSLDEISFIWENANPDVEVIAEDLQSDYYSYCFKESNETKNINFIKGYKKITYKNLYPNIDVEYTFHATNGIKYTLILHPGADVSKIKMKYKDPLKLRSNGDLYISTLFGDIIDHAPKSYYTDNLSSKIRSHFTITENTIGFDLNSYDHSKSITIDPWTVMPTLSNSNCVWECDRDAAGNVYIIGGDVPLKLLKYNSGGLLQWTYNTPWDTVSGDWLGTLATDLAGNSYVTNGSSAALQKINATGGMAYSVNGGMLDEYWKISFNCDQTKLIIGGTRLGIFPPANSYGVIFDINASNGSVNNFQIVGKTRPYSLFGIPVTDIDEVRSMTASRNAKYYFLTLDSMGAIDQNIGNCPTSTALFKLPHTYELGYKCENFRPNNGNAGLSAIRANRYFVYTQNGSTIHKRSLSDGSILATAAIPGGINNTTGFSTPTLYNVGNSGIDIDTCGNVYVGSGNALVKYDENLNFISSVSTPFRVYDVAVSTGGNVVFCGATNDNSYTSPRTGYIRSEYIPACNPISLVCCDANICPSGPYCNNDPAINLTPSSPGGIWSGPGITNPSAGTFNPAVAGVGTHTIVYSLACGSDSTTIVVDNCVICPPITFTLSNIVNVDCGGTLGSFTALATGGTDPYYYILLNSNGDTIAEFTSASGPQDFSGLYADDYILIVSDNALCPGDTSITITSPSNMTLAFTSVDETCSGSCNGQLTCTVSGGLAPFLYAWSNGMGTATISNICGGNYSVTVTDATGCSKVGQGTVNTGVVVNLTLTPQNETCKNNCDGQISSAVSGGKPPYTYSWSNGKTTSNISNLCANSYTLTVTDSNGCKRNATTIVGTDIIVTANFTANPSTGGVPLSVNFLYTGSGGSSFNYTFGDGTTSTDQNPFHVFDSIGVYTVILIVNSGAPDFCADTFRVLVEVIMPSMIVVPNVFTPNNDGVNDQFLMQSKSIETFNCTVFNRWGEKVYEWTDISIGWDGRTKSGAAAAAGVYYYVIKAVGVDKQEYNLHGTVTLLR